MRRYPPSLAACCLLLACLAGAASRADAGILGTGTCIVGNRPAATLLIPYFEVDLDHPTHTTLVGITNNDLGIFSPGKHIVRVVLWTDWGIPTLSFDVYLGPSDIQTLNLYDLMAGKLPATATSVDLSQFPHCKSPGNLPGGQFVQASIDRLRARHVGQPDPGTTTCAGAPHGDHIARGYMTVDVVDRCQELSSLGVGTPANYGAGNSTYFPASDPNVLSGDYIYIDTVTNQAEGNAAVPLIADSTRFKNDGTMTFWGRYYVVNSLQQGGIDHRAPLSSSYHTRYLEGGGFDGGTRLVVWREVPATSPLSCGAHPQWYPLAQDEIVAFDEASNMVEIYGKTGSAFPLATQARKVGELGGAPLPAGAGALELFLGRAGKKAQAYVVPVLSSKSRYSVGFDATRIDDLCGAKP